MRFRRMTGKPWLRVLVVAGLLGGTLTTGASAGAAPARPTPPVPVPPAGSVYASWSYTDAQLTATVPKARASDVASPRAVVRALHESVSGPKGQWNGARLRSLVLPNVFFGSIDKSVQGDTQISNNSLVDFLGAVQGVHAQSAWYERVTRIVSVSETRSKNGGALAVVHYVGGVSTTPGGPVATPGESQAMLMFDGKRWWCAGDTW
jgi:hypothetical protein